MTEQDAGRECTGAEVARLIVAALIGVVIGASLGLLLAPKPGTDLRSDIRGAAGTAAEKAQVVTAKARDLVEAAKHKIEERRGTHAAEEPAVEEAAEA